MENEICHLNLEEIIPKNYIPHDNYDTSNNDLQNNLVESIKNHGIIQPIVVKKNNDKYVIIDGNRRYYAAIKAGLKKIPALVRNDCEVVTRINLTDNFYNNELSPIEEAKKYREILDNSSITQEQLAKNIGKSQSALANKLRLLNLPSEIQEALNNFEISERHARSLLTVKSNELQLKLLKKIKEEKLTVRELDSEIKNMSNMFIPEEFSNKNNNKNDNNQTNVNNNMDYNNSSNTSNMFIPNNIASNEPDNRFIQNNQGLNTINNNVGEMIPNILPSSNESTNPFFTSNQYIVPNINDGNKNDSVNSGSIDNNLNPVNPFSSIRMNTNNLNNNYSNVSETNSDSNFDINDYKLPEYENNVDSSVGNDVSSNDQSPISFTAPVEVDTSNDYKYVEDNPNYVTVDNPQGVASIDDVIEVLRSSLEKIKNGKIKVDTEEIDYDDTYQITIRIDKKGDFL